MNFLDESGLKKLWSKIKSYVKNNYLPIVSKGRVTPNLLLQFLSIGNDNEINGTTYDSAGNVIYNNQVHINYTSSGFVTLAYGGGYVVACGRERLMGAALSVHGSIAASGSISGNTSSDERLKENIKDIDCLSIINSMGGTKAFTYKENGEKSIGFIAQNVRNCEFMKGIVTEDKNGYLGINYWDPKLVSVSFGAIEQLQGKIEGLEKKLSELQGTEVS